MNISIVTTTINSPTIATQKFCKIAQEKQYTFFIVGDKKTPHDLYQNLERKYGTSVKYVHPDEQEYNFKDLSDNIGWNSIQRRNIGFIYALKNNAEIVATVDDDNIPYDSWSSDLYIGQEIECDLYETSNGVFDPLSVTNYPQLWHRGFPIDLLLEKNSYVYKGKNYIKPLIQADLWDGDPDIDAMCRLNHKPLVKFNISEPYYSTSVSPFNSQNTFLHQSVMKYYYVLPHVGRMDDIWPSYAIQKKFPNSLIYNTASVYQDRNPQDLIKNLENEIIGYRNTLKLINNEDVLPSKSKEFIEIYQSLYE